TSAEPITDFEGYIRSDVTNKAVPVNLIAAEIDAPNVCTPTVPTASKDTLGIPAFADFDVVSFEGALYVNIPHDGFPLQKFLTEFVPFTVVVKYNGTKYQRQF